MDISIKYHPDMSDAEITARVKDAVAKRVGEVFADVNKPRVQEMVDFGLPKPQAQALYSHWNESLMAGNAYDLTKLVKMLCRAERDKQKMLTTATKDSAETP